MIYLHHILKSPEYHTPLLSRKWPGRPASGRALGVPGSSLLEAAQAATGQLDLPSGPQGRWADAWSQPQRLWAADPGLSPPLTLECPREAGWRSASRQGHGHQSCKQCTVRPSDTVDALSVPAGQPQTLRHHPRGPHILLPSGPTGAEPANLPACRPPPETPWHSRRMHKALHHSTLG